MPANRKRSTPRRASNKKPGRQTQRTGTRVRLPSNAFTGKTRRANLKFQQRRATRNTRTGFASIPQLKGISNIAVSLALPLERTPIRAAVGITDAPTALAHPFSREDVQFQQGSSAATSPIPAGSTLVMVFRDPLRAEIIYQPNHEQLSYKYEANFVVDDAYSSFQYIDCSSNGADLQPLWWASAASAAWAPHGPVLYSGATAPDGLAYTFHNGTASGEKFKFNLRTDGDADAHYKLTATLFGTAVQHTYNGLGPLEWDAAEVGYWAFHVVPITSDVSPIPVDGKYRLYAEVSGSKHVFAHRAVPDLERNFYRITSMAVNASSLMVTPNAPALTIQGRIVSLQLPRGTPWTDLLKKSKPFDTISAMQNSVHKTFAQGVHGFSIPSHLDDFKRFAYTKYDAEHRIVTRARFQFNDFPFLASAVQCAQAASDVYPAGLIVVSNAWTIEYETVDLWTQTDIPRVSTDAFQRAVQALAKARLEHQWVDNPLHISDIVNWARGASAKVAAWIPKITQFLTLIGSGATLLSAL